MRPWNTFTGCSYVARPSVRMVQTKNGMTAMAQFSLAFPDRSDPNNKDKTAWVRCVAWGQKADFFEKYCTETGPDGNLIAKKGTVVAVTGALSHNTYTTPEGIVREVTQISVDQIYLMGNAQQQQPDQDDTEVERVPTPITNRKATTPPPLPADFDRDKIPF